MKLFKIFIILSILGSELSAKSFVTYGSVGGRLGDFLIAYMHAAWVSYKYNLEILYNPFEYSDQLEIHRKDALYTKNHKKMRHISLKPGMYLDQFINPKLNNVIYVIPYFPESKEEHLPVNCPFSNHTRNLNQYPFFDVDWNDLAFKKMLQEKIKPINSLSLIHPPKDRVSIAVHIRKNSNGFDLPLINELEDESLYNPNQKYVDILLPLKHPPESYYIEQIKYLAEIYRDNKLYLFIFTDDVDPEKITNRIKSQIIHDDIVFDYRKNINNHFSNVLEDLFSILNFDCFIRPDSNMTIAAGKIGNFKMLISPAHHTWVGKKMIIDKVNIE